ncbi:MAG TPA: glycosyltransferase family 2 protein [Acidimicrobiales bacterium]
MVDPKPCLSVVMPCFNEQATVETVVEQVLASPWTAELIIVDDGSTDGTRKILAGIDDPRVRVLLQPYNQGKGAALRRGFAEARADYVVVQDADLEYDPAEYGTLVRPLLKDQADVVYGSRFHSSQPHRVLYFWHSVGNKFLTLLSNMFTNLNLTDMETCYKVFRREVIQSITIEEDRFGFEPEVTAKVAQDGWRVYELGISYNGRTYDEGKKIGWKDGVRAVQCILKYSRTGVRVRQLIAQYLGPNRGVDTRASLPESAAPEPADGEPTDPATASDADPAARTGSGTGAISTTGSSRPSPDGATALLSTNGEHGSGGSERSGV